MLPTPPTWPSLPPTYLGWPYFLSLLFSSLLNTAPVGSLDCAGCRDRMAPLWHGMGTAKTFYKHENGNLLAQLNVASRGCASTYRQKLLRKAKQDLYLALDFLPTSPLPLLQADSHSNAPWRQKGARQVSDRRVAALPILSLLLHHPPVYCFCFSGQANGRTFREACRLYLPTTSLPLCSTSDKTPEQA